MYLNDHKCLEEYVAMLMTSDVKLCVLLDRRDFFFVNTHPL